MNKLIQLCFLLLAVATFSATSENIQAPPDCPPTSGVPIFFPDPEACNMYYICTEAGPVHMTCPPPLLWDQSISACNMPGPVQCVITTTTVRTTTTTTARTTTPTTTTTAGSL